MKKILIGLTIALSFIGINKVSAETYELFHSNTAEISCDFYVTDYDYLKELGYEDEVRQLYNLIIKKYNEEYSSTYPYFFIGFSASSSLNCNFISSFDEVGAIHMRLYMYLDVPLISSGGMFPTTPTYIDVSYNVSKSTYTLPLVHINEGSAVYTTLFSRFSNYYNPLSFFISNFEASVDDEDSYIITGNSNFTINPGDVIKPYYTVENAFQEDYIEVNLNDYAYVALSLKDYTQNAFSVDFMVKGQFCATPVYNYGMSSKDSVINNKVEDRCSLYYDALTSYRFYVLDSDLNNNSIYYLKSYDTTKENIIKVDTSIFDITYISEEDKDNPYVNVNGKVYPTIPYDELPSTATKNEEENYIPGKSEQFSFSDIFTKPLDFLKDIWASISSVFGLVTELFSLLPEPMPTFLFVSFTLAIILGLLKIIL